MEDHARVASLEREQFATEKIIIASQVTIPTRLVRIHTMSDVFLVGLSWCHEWDPGGQSIIAVLEIHQERQGSPKGCASSVVWDKAQGEGESRGRRPWPVAFVHRPRQAARQRDNKREKVSSPWTTPNMTHTDGLICSNRKSPEEEATQEEADLEAMDVVEDLVLSSDEDDEWNCPWFFDKELETMVEFWSYLVYKVVLEESSFTTNTKEHKSTHAAFYLLPMVGSQHPSAKPKPNDESNDSRHNDHMYAEMIRGWCDAGGPTAALWEDTTWRFSVGHDTMGDTVNAYLWDGCR